MSEYEDLCDLIMEVFPTEMVAETRDVDELVMAAGAEIKDLRTIVAEIKAPYGPEDRLDQYSKPISAAHPLRTGDHGRYARALQMVGARHSKYALVDLVNWLLYRIEEKK